MSKPPFDPSQPFDAGAKPAFNPNQPFSAGDQSGSAPQDSGINWKQAASDYLIHPAIEGGAMALGGAAGGVLGSAAGPVGTAAGATAGSIAMYPPAHQFANAVDQYMGNTPQLSNGVMSDLGQGAKIEATSAALKPVLGAVGNLLPGAKTGEALSGTPANNLTRAYDQGFKKTYLDPLPLAKASENFGTAKTAMGGALTPEQQVAMTINPSGQANQKVSDVMLSWLKGEPISGQDALAARQGIDTIFPADTMKKQVQRGALGQFRSALNDILDSENPAMKKASDDYAASKLRSQLMMPARVNKSNPNQYSKLGAILETIAMTGGAGFGHAIPVAAGIVGTSPLAMGVASSAAGSTSRGINSALSNPAISKAIAAYVASRYPRDGQ